MAKVYGLYVGLVTALALSKYTLAEWNATEESANRTVSHCRLHGDGDNCTDTDEWGGHFSKCPDSHRNYCVHGECRYVKDQEAPSCRCQLGYEGSRCEYLNLGWLIGDKQGIIIACAIVGLLLLISLLVFVCVCPRRRCRFCWRRRRRREEPRNGTEKLGMMDATQSGLTTDATEPPRTEAV